MATLNTPPPIALDRTRLAEFGKTWADNGNRLRRSPPNSSLDLGRFIDSSVAMVLSEMLGDIPVLTPNSNSLLPPEPDCVELGAFRVVGGVRAQNFDVGYRPDGVRIAFDSKTLNDTDSVRKNYQNMINDLATEATTVHSRFPYAVVAFIIAIPKPCLGPTQSAGITATLERLTGRRSVMNQNHLAEAIGFVVWDPDSGEIDSETPAEDSSLRIENFSIQVGEVYTARYKGLPPH